MASSRQTSSRSGIRALSIGFIDVVLCAAFPLRVLRNFWRRIRARTPYLQPHNILIVRTDHIGDAYLSLPAIAWVRSHFPAAQITVLAASWSVPLFEAAKLQDHLITCDAPWWVKNRSARFGTSGARGTWSDLLQTILMLRKQRFDLCIEMRGDVRQIVAFGVLTNARHLLTRSRNGGRLLADIVPTISDRVHEMDQNTQLVQALAPHQPMALQFPTPYHPHDVEKLRLLGVLAGGNKRLVIHPGAKWVNRWPQTSFQLLVEHLLCHTELDIYLTGAAAEAQLCDSLIDRSDSRVRNLAGKLSLTEHAALLDHVDFVVMADTGPMHFLNSMKTPAIVLFGPTDPLRFAPRGAHVHTLTGGSCCMLDLHEHCTTVPTGCHSACMNAISVEAVLNACRLHFGLFA